MRVNGNVEVIADPVDVAATLIFDCRDCRSNFFAEFGRLAEVYEDVYTDMMADMEDDVPPDCLPPTTWEGVCDQIVDDLDEQEKLSLAAALAVLIVKLRADGNEDE